MEEQLRKNFRDFLLTQNKEKQQTFYNDFTSFVLKNLEDFFQLKITPKENASLIYHYLFNFGGGERTYIRDTLYHYGKMDVLAERASIGDLLFFQTNDKTEKISNIGFYIGDFKVLYFDEQHQKVCMSNLYKNTKLTKSFVGIKNIESFSKVIQTPENTK